jgi:hypothetical protein
MTARRILAGLALLLAASTAAACAQVVPGSGTVAADARTGGGGGPTGSSSPTSTGEPTSSPATTGDSPTPTASSSGSGGTSPVCQALDKAAVESAFGTEVTFGRSQSSGCQIRASDGRSMIVAVFDYLKLSEYKRPGSTELKVSGYPAVRTSTTIIYVGRSMDPAAAGLVAAYFSGLRDNGDPIAIKVLEQLIAKYKK